MYPPFTIGDIFRIIPPGAPPSTDGRIDLIMERGAFGSGEHETTVRCGREPPGCSEGRCETARRC